MRPLAPLLWCPLLSCVLLASRPALAGAQSPPDVVGGWLSVARNSPFITRAGTKHRDFYAVALRAGWMVGSFPGVTLSYTTDVLPIVVTTNNVNGFDVHPCSGPSDECRYVELRTGTVYGAGLSPVGLTATFGPFAFVSVQVNASAGALWFTRAVPDPQALKFNFTVSGGGAVEVPLRAGYAALFGYMRHHTSNAGLGRVNPGLDANVFYAGMTRRRGRTLK